MLQNGFRSWKESKDESWVDEITGVGNGTRSTPIAHKTLELYNVYSVPGDFKNPSPQSFSKIQQTSFHGVYTQSKLIVPENGPSRRFNYIATGVMNDQFAPDYRLPDPGTYNKCLEKVGETIRGSVDVSIDAFQYSQTIQLAQRILSVRKIVTTIALRLSREAKRVHGTAFRGGKIQQMRWVTVKGRRRRKKVYVNPLSPISEIGGIWLEAQYGLIPTLSTIHDLVTQSYVRAGNSLALKTPAGRDITASNVVDSRSSSTEANSRTTAVTKSSYRCKICGSYTPSNSYLEVASRLSSLNPLSIAWELLPFSFVIDWFYDVGGYLRMAETALISNLGTFAGYMTTTSRHETTVTIDRFGKDRYDYTYGGSESATTISCFKNRVLLSRLPYPDPPKFRADLGSGRLLNAAALLSQFIKR